MRNYGKIARLGMDRSHKDMLGKTVRVEEKIDGSQFSFMLGLDGQPYCRSRNNSLAAGQGGQFSGAVAYVHSIEDKLLPGFVYRGECVSRARHNKITYDRVPTGNIVLWSVESRELVSDETLETGGYFNLIYHDPHDFAERLGLEAVPVIATLELDEFALLDKFIEGPSMLGGQREGIVVKCGGLKAKLVSPAFTEVVVKKRVTASDEEFLRELGTRYAPNPRRDKAVAYLRDSGELKGSMADIGPIIKRINQDVLEECTDQIKAELFAKYWKFISKGINEGVATWYVDLLKDVYGE